MLRTLGLERADVVQICSWCKVKIKDEQGSWVWVFPCHIREVIKRTPERVSHGICPSCRREFFPELYSDD